MMKKFFLFFVMMGFFANTAKAQDLNFMDSDSVKLFSEFSFDIQTSTFGVVFLAKGLDEEEKPVVYDSKLSFIHLDVEPILMLSTSKKTYHLLSAQWFGKSIQVTNGVYLPKDFDLYLVFSRRIKEKENYFGAGIKWKYSLFNFDQGNVKFNLFLAFEIGTDFKGEVLSSIGIILDGQILIWPRKK